MSNNLSIYESPIFFGAYCIINNDTGERIDCHNLRTARSILENQFKIADSGKTEIKRQISTEEFYGCLTGGMGYTPAITWTLTGRVERVHNWATANDISRRYPKK
tara:strand:+ start:307 stop:621 length:315 start_codon:yes stop_codon:yes gene_type:complete